MIDLGFILQLGQCHGDLGQVVGLRILLHVGERLEGTLLVLDGTLVVGGLRVHFAHLEVRVAKLLLALLRRLLGVFNWMR